MVIRSLTQVARTAARAEAAATAPIQAKVVELQRSWTAASNPRRALELQGAQRKLLSTAPSLRPSEGTIQASFHDRTLRANTLAVRDADIPEFREFRPTQFAQKQGRLTQSVHAFVAQRDPGFVQLSGRQQGAYLEEVIARLRTHVDSGAEPVVLPRLSKEVRKAVNAMQRNPTEATASEAREKLLVQLMKTDPVIARLTRAQVPAGRTMEKVRERVDDVWYQLLDQYPVKRSH